MYSRKKGWPSGHPFYLSNTSALLPDTVSLAFPDDNNCTAHRICNISQRRVEILKFIGPPPHIYGRLPAIERVVPDTIAIFKSLAADHAAYRHLADVAVYLRLGVLHGSRACRARLGRCRRRVAISPAFVDLFPFCQFEVPGQLS